MEITPALMEKFQKRFPSSQVSIKPVAGGLLLIVRYEGPHGDAETFMKLYETMEFYYAKSPTFLIDKFFEDFKKSFD